MRVGRVAPISFIKEAAREFHDDDVLGLSAEIAFRLIFSLPPLLIFFTALSTVADEYTGVDVFALVQRQISAAAIPQAVKETLMLALGTVQNQNATSLLSVGIVVALWSASGAFNAMIKALNRAYDVQDGRNFVTQRLLALGLTIGLSLMVITSLVLFIFGGRFGEWLAGWAGYGSAFASTWGIARWTLIVALIMLALAILYWAGPAIEKSFHWISPGAVLTTALWLGATWAFSLYLRVSDLGSAYGTFGALVVLLFFLYISSIVLLIGAEVNAILDKRFDPEVVRDKAAHPERQTENPARVRERARRLAARESPLPQHNDGRATADHPTGYAAVADAERARVAGAEPSRGALIALIVSMGSVLLAGLLGALRRGSRERV